MLTLLQQAVDASFVLRRNHVEGEDEVARIVGFPDRVADVDVDDARVRGVETDEDIAYLDARLPAPQRGANGCRDARRRLAVGAVEDVIVDLATELRPH